MDREAKFTELARRLAQRNKELDAIECAAAFRATGAANEEPPSEPPPSLDYVARRMHERMIWQLIYRYPGCGFRDLYERAVRGRGCLAKLSDYEVAELHDKLDRARECLADGISLEDAGIL